jgi:hypothetical protein
MDQSGAKSQINIAISIEGNMNYHITLRREHTVTVKLHNYK